MMGRAEELVAVRRHGGRRWGMLVVGVQMLLRWLLRVLEEVVGEVLGGDVEGVLALLPVWACLRREIGGGGRPELEHLCGGRAY